MRISKYLKKTEYKYVYSITGMVYGHRSPYKYRAMLGAKGVHRSWSKSFNELKDAAKAVDLKLIERGKEPINILIRA